MENSCPTCRTPSSTDPCLRCGCRTLPITSGRSIADAADLALVTSSARLWRVTGGAWEHTASVLVSGIGGSRKTTSVYEFAHEAILAGHTVELIDAEMPDALSKATWLRVGTMATAAQVKRHRVTTWSHARHIAIKSTASIIIFDSLHRMTKDVDDAVKDLSTMRGLKIGICQANDEGEPKGGNELEHNADAVIVLNADPDLDWAKKCRWAYTAPKPEKVKKRGK